jgi:hypothetical protein
MPELPEEIEQALHDILERLACERIDREECEVCLGTIDCLRAAITAALQQERERCALWCAANLPDRNELPREYMARAIRALKEAP